MSDSRTLLFVGLVLLVFSIYTLIVSVSYFRTLGRDQSSVLNGEFAPELITNSGGPFGAWLSNMLIHDWLGVGAFILIIYIGVCGLILLRVFDTDFWKLTLRCLLTATAISIIGGFVTVNLASPIYWGGMHGHLLNEHLMVIAGVWGALAVSIVMAGLVGLLFFRQIKSFFSLMSQGVAAFKLRRARRREERRAREEAEARLRSEAEAREAEIAAIEDERRKAEASAALDRARAQADAARIEALRLEAEAAQLAQTAAAAAASKAAPVAPVVEAVAPVDDAVEKPVVAATEVPAEHAPYLPAAPKAETNVRVEKAPVAASKDENENEAPEVKAIDEKQPEETEPALEPSKKIVEPASRPLFASFDEEVEVSTPEAAPAERIESGSTEEAEEPVAETAPLFGPMQEGEKEDTLAERVAAVEDRPLFVAEEVEEVAAKQPQIVEAQPDKDFATVKDEEIARPATTPVSEAPTSPLFAPAEQRDETPETIETVSPAVDEEEPEEEETPEVAYGQIGSLYDPRADLPGFRFPSIDILPEFAEDTHGYNADVLQDNMDRITKTLADYNIRIESIEATVGPTVILYEIVPAEGVRVARVKSLEDDLALKLAAIGVRIIAPMPGRGTVGIEVPREDPQTVSMKSVIDSPEFNDSKMELPMAIGRTVSNQVFVKDLAKMPHLLVAGATGMGKSVGLNAIITSLLYKKHPAELKFVLIDPKQVEFNIYAKLEKHYLAKLPDEEEPVIVEPQKAIATLNSLCVEMENRYALLKKADMRNIKDYNHLFVNRRLNPEHGHKFLPYIVVIVDEFADLIMMAGKDIETPIARIAQKARAVGIHMIIATQRPSTNVITGLIKANFPGRIAFRVFQMVDSRTILDRPGANQLIGRGDLLFSNNGKIDRVQCAFIDTPEVLEICRQISTQASYPMAYELPEYIEEGNDAGASSGGKMANLGDRDPLFEECARHVVSANLASTSALQRHYSIGFNRAGKIMDQMEAVGIVGPAQGGKPRQVLTDPIGLEAILASI